MKKFKKDQVVHYKPSQYAAEIKAVVVNKWDKEENGFKILLDLNLKEKVPYLRLARESELRHCGISLGDKVFVEPGPDDLSGQIGRVESVTDKKDFKFDEKLVVVDISEKEGVGSYCMAPESAIVVLEKGGWISE